MRASGLLPLALTLIVSVAAAAGAATDPRRLPRSHPEAEGISSRGLLHFVETADREIQGLHSLMIVRHGKVVAEGWWTPYDPETPHELYSLSKSFTSTAVGIAIDEGRLRLEDSVLEAFPGQGPADPSPALRAMRLHDLLRMGTGHQTEPGRFDGMTVSNFLVHPVPFKPGTHFLYNTPATFMASAMLQKATGQSVLDYLRPRLFDPLGITQPLWGTNSEGITLGGYGLSIRTEDIACFGQLLLQKGVWQGRQLVSSRWVEAATSLQIANGSNPASDWDQGYGYQFWRCQHGAYRGDGAFGQYCVVMPDQDLVVAITSGLGNMQAVLTLLWDRLLPELRHGALPPDPAAAEALVTKLRSLTLPTPQGPIANPTSAQISGRRFKLPANDLKLESVGLEFGKDQVPRFITVRDGREESLVVGHARWVRGTAAKGTPNEEPVALAGAWTADNVFTLQMWRVRTPFRLTLPMEFSAGEMTVEPQWNVGFGPTRMAKLTGKAGD